MLLYWEIAKIYQYEEQYDSTVWYLREYDHLQERMSERNAVGALQFAEASFETEKKELETDKSAQRPACAYATPC